MQNGYQNVNVTGGTADNKTVLSCSRVIISQTFTLKSHYSKKESVIQYPLHCCACVLTQMQIKYFTKNTFVRIISAITCRLLLLLTNPRNVYTL